MKYILGTLFLITVTFLIYCFFPVINYNRDISLAPGRIFLTDRNGQVLTDKALPNGYYRPYENENTENSPFILALLQIEDKNFFSHWGVNFPAKLRAVVDNIKGKRISGGSTITEQYVKNKYFQDTSRNYLQKFREAVLALYINATIDKQKILSLYLDDVYFGNQNYGIAAAMEVYFKKQSLSDLTPEEIVLLISLIHNPGIQSLEETYFQEYFLQVQQRLGYSFERSYIGKLPKKENIDLFPHLTQRWIQGDFGYPDQRLALDIRLQNYAQDTMRESLETLKDKNVTNAAMFALDPKTGEVLLYLGSKDFSAKDIDGQVDVVQARRQVGSTLKPFLYLLALKSGAHPDDLIVDVEGQYESFQDGKVYISENYSLQEYGFVRLKKALGNSFNNASVRLARELGLEKVYDFYKLYGLSLPYSAEHYGYSLVLGNPDLSLENMIYSYIKLIPDTQDIEKYLLYDMLSDSDNRDISFGVNSLLSSSIAQAVKTGTSTDFRDNWVISYHPDFVFGVWVGNNDNSSMQGVTGISGAGYMWHQVIEKSIELGYIKNTPIVAPAGVVQIPYCLDRNCFRKENVYSTPGKNYSSAIADKIFHRNDIFENLSLEEQERLAALGFQIAEK